MHAVFKLSSVLLGKEFLLHKNQIVFSGPMRILNLFSELFFSENTLESLKTACIYDFTVYYCTSVEFFVLYMYVIIHT